MYPIGNSVGTVRAAGRDWALHIGYNGAMKVFSFVAANPVTRFDGEIMDFFYLLRDMQGYPMTSQYLLSKKSTPNITVPPFVPGRNGKVNDSMFF